MRVSNDETMCLSGPNLSLTFTSLSIVIAVFIIRAVW
jgi:hypothetical protein